MDTSPAQLCSRTLVLRIREAEARRCQNKVFESSPDAHGTALVVFFSCRFRGTSGSFFLKPSQQCHRLASLQWNGQRFFIIAMQKIYIYIFLDLNIQQHVARIWQLHATQVRAIIKTVRCSVVTSCDAFREGRDKCSQGAGYVLKTCLTKQWQRECLQF